MELYFVGCEDADEFEKSVELDKVWSGVTKRVFLGSYILTKDEYDRMNTNATENERKDIRVLIDDLDNYLIRELMSDLVSMEHRILEHLWERGFDSLASKFIKISDREHDRFDIRDLAFEIGKHLSSLSEGELNKLVEDDYNFDVFMKLVIKSLRSIR